MKVKKRKILITAEMEIILQSYFNISGNIIVPNISWGLGLHECDLLVMSKKGYLTEIEIKVSSSDLKKDMEKRHQHRSKKIKSLYFAIPWYLLDDKDYIPARAGIIVVSEKRQISIVRTPRTNKHARALTEKERFQFVRLGSFRIWSLKRKMWKLTKSLKEMRETIKSLRKEVMAYRGYREDDRKERFG